MRRAAEVLFLLALGLLSCEREEALSPDGIGLRASISADSAGLGDPIRLRVEATIPGTARGRLLVDGDSIGAWRILGTDRPQVRKHGDLRRERMDLTVASFRLGMAGPDSIRYDAVIAPGETLRLAAPAPLLRIGGQIRSDQPIDPSAAKEIRDVISTGVPAWVWFAGAAALAAAASAAAVRLLRRRRADATPAEPPGPTPEEEFEAAIARLLASGVLERGEVQEFYYAVSAAVRRYLERVHDMPLLESTSAEVMALLGSGTNGERSREALAAWLREGDLVKYARLDRLRAEASGYLERSREIIRLHSPPPSEGAPSNAANPGPSGGAPV